MLKDLNPNLYEVETAPQLLSLYVIISWVCDCVTAVCSKAFIRVLDREVEKKVLLQCHMNDGCLCDI